MEKKATVEDNKTNEKYLPKNVSTINANKIKTVSYADVLKTRNSEHVQPSPSASSEGNDLKQLSCMMMRFMESMEKNMNLMMQNISSLIQLLTQNITAQK